MAVVIRLQGLKITAGSEDIRRFFTGLKIPDGGVHIIGGEREEAFIIFASDEDARRAMTRSGGLIKDSPVTLLLSSKAEMQNMLERSTENEELGQKRKLGDNTRRAHRSAEPDASRRLGSRSGYTPTPQHQMASNDDDGLCLFLKGLPFSVTEKEVCDFFSGLLIDDVVLLKNQNGSNKGTGLVKFATREDAMEGLKRDREYIGARYIEISKTTMDSWRWNSGGEPLIHNIDDRFKRGRSPVPTQRNPQLRLRSRSPVDQRHIAHSDEYCVLLDNLSFAVEKEDIKEMFHNAKLEDDQILHLNGSDGRRTRSAFVLFKNLRDYGNALSLQKRQLFNRWVGIRPISRENMISLLESQSMAVRAPGNSERNQTRAPSYPRDPYNSENICMYVQNLPFDVRKVEVMDFFHGFNITDDKVHVLHDHKGDGVGKALVLFGSEAEAARALSLNGRRFLGSEVILKTVSRSQMQQLITEPPVVRDSSPTEERYVGRSSEPSFHSGDSFFSDIQIPFEDNMPVSAVQDHRLGGFDFDRYAVAPRSPVDRGNGVRGRFDPPVQQFDGPACVQLVNLPFQIKSQEIYDFCYGYHIIPGSVSLQYDQSGKPKGSAILVFQSRQEALTAVKELSGRPIGPRKIQLLLV